MPAAQSAVIPLPHPNSSDVFLFLRREEGGEARGGRAATVTQDGFFFLFWRSVSAEGSGE